MAIIGRNTKDASTYGSAAHRALYQQYTTDGNGGVVGSLHAYVKNTAAGVRYVEMGIYDHDPTNDLPEALQLAAITIAVPASHDGEVSGEYAATLAANTKYWIALVAADASVQLYYLVAGSGNSGYYDIGVDNLPDPFGDSATSIRAYAYDFWADYEPAGVAPSGIGSGEAHGTATMRGTIQSEV
jgi:hypothetical protein